MKRVNELKDALKHYQGGAGGMGDPSKLMATAAKQLFTNMDFKGEPFAPMGFVQTLRMVCPQFNETDDHGHHKQQDAEECYSQLLTAFKEALKLNHEDQMMSGGAKDMIEKLFGIELVNTVKNKESEAEPI